MHNSFNFLTVIHLFQKTIIALFFLLASWFSCANGVAIDTIYKPYVAALENEFEYRTIYYNGNDSALDQTQQHKLAYGQSINEKWFAEIYLNTLSSSEQDLTTNGFEIETKYQLTEQGEYFIDTGFLFEFEREKLNNIWEVSSAILLSKEFKRYIATGNIFFIIEQGEDIPREFETALNFQLLYRTSAEISPALEIYQAEDTRGIGPLITGRHRIGLGKKIYWEIGVIYGLYDDMPKNTIKGLIEYEFP